VTTTDAGEQLDLFGNPTPADPCLASGSGRRGGPDTNDVDLVRNVAGNAVRGLYLLVGQVERVYARADGPDSDHAVRVPRYEEDAVHQLLRRGWLTRGGVHPVRCGAASLHGIAVLAPKATRARVARWDHLARPANWRNDTTKGRR
jgi:hypothetical protein